MKSWLLIQDHIFSRRYSDHKEVITTKAAGSQSRGSVCRPRVSHLNITSVGQPDPQVKVHDLGGYDCHVPHLLLMTLYGTVSSALSIIREALWAPRSSLEKVCKTRLTGSQSVILPQAWTCTSPVPPSGDIRNTVCQSLSEVQGTLL